MSVEKAARDFKRSMEKLGVGVTISVPGHEPVVIVDPPKEAQVNATAAPIHIPQQLSFDIGGDISRPTGASFAISGSGAIRSQLFMRDDVTIRVIAADGEIVGEFDGHVTKVAFKEHKQTETEPEWVERVHTIKLGDRIED